MSERCPHCAQPGLFPNVLAAEDSPEISALEKRCQAAIKDTSSRGCDKNLKDFGNAVETSYAVINRSLVEIDRLATSDNELYATYYQLIESGVRLPKGSKWDVLRAVSDDAIFPGYKKDIRFGVLSITGMGLTNYGDCSLVLKSNMIAHRASVFEQNSVVFMEQHGVSISKAHDLPKGYRATWNDRGKLATAKIAGEITMNTEPDEYANLLLSEGNTPADDRFIEVHIWGPMTIRTFERVIANRPKKRLKRIILKALEERLQEANVDLEIR